MATLFCCIIIILILLFNENIVALLQTKKFGEQITSIINQKRTKNCALKMAEFLLISQAFVSYCLLHITLLHLMK